MPTRRRFLAAAGGAVVLAVVGAGVESPAVRRRLHELTDPEPVAPDPTAAAGPRMSGTFSSSARRQDVAWQLAYPPGSRPGDPLPVAVVLHGRGGNERSAFADLSLDGYLADVVTAGAPPFALASVDGGDDTYWHRRRDGDDPPAMLTGEFLPLLDRVGLRTAKVGLFGWSMGGYGALLLAETLGAQRVAGVAADSPALWHRAGDAAAGAFDGAADFAAHDVVAARQRLAGIPVRIACGDSDPFFTTAREFARTLPDLAGTEFSAGGHTDTFWRRTAPGQLRFLASALRRV